MKNFTASIEELFHGMLERASELASLAEARVSLDKKNTNTLNTRPGRGYAEFNSLKPQPQLLSYPGAAFGRANPWALDLQKHFTPDANLIKCQDGNYLFTQPLPYGLNQHNLHLSVQEDYLVVEGKIHAAKSLQAGNLETFELQHEGQAGQTPPMDYSYAPSSMVRTSREHQQMFSSRFFIGKGLYIAGANITKERLLEVILSSSLRTNPQAGQTYPSKHRTWEQESAAKTLPRHPIRGRSQATDATYHGRSSTRHLNHSKYKFLRTKFKGDNYDLPRNA